MKFVFIFSFIAFIFSAPLAQADRWGADKTLNPSSAPKTRKTRATTTTTTTRKTTTSSASPSSSTPMTYSRTPNNSSNMSFPSSSASSTTGESNCNGGREVCEKGLCRCEGLNQNSQHNQEAAESPSSMAQTLASQCAEDSQQALNACDKDHDEGIQGAQTTLSNFAVGMGQQGIAAACTGMAKYVAGANAAVLYFQQNCSSSRNKCMQSCQQARAAADGTSLAGQIDNYYGSCKGLESEIAKANQAMQNMVGTVQASLACANQTDTGMMDYCRSNPGAVGCTNAAMDCSNPQVAASNPICICKANPNSPTCTGMQAKAGDFGGGKFDSSSTSPTAAKAGAGGSSLDTDNLFANADFAGNGMTPSKESAEDVGGKKGGRPLIDEGGGASGSEGDSGKGGNSEADALAVNAGFRGGGSGGGWGGSGSSYGTGGSSGAGYGANPNESGPNLRDFLPNGKFDPKMKNRGLAGISGPDGITGPHSDIWKKIQNRYQVQIEKSALMP